MSKLTSMFAGAALACAGGMLGWFAHSFASRPAANGACAASRELADELALLRASLTTALERASAPATPVLDSGTARVPVAQDAAAGDTVSRLALALQRFERLAERWESASTSGAPASLPSDGRRFVPEATALDGFTRVEDIGARFDELEKLWVESRVLQPMDDFVARLSEVYRFWTLDQVLELHGRPDEVHDCSGQLTIVYRRAPGVGSNGALHFSITGGRVVSTSYELD